MTGDAVHWRSVRRPGRDRARQAHLPDQPPADRGPVRTCVGCRTRAVADDLLRVVAVDGMVIPDPRRRLPGRGAWLHPLPECLSRAERRSAFPRALRVAGPLDVDQVRSFLQHP
ncbi:MAG TPA: YlxR family protein [Geodermatophilus sp.]|nr:YlxR family protein [Geodermatophilus sp.]